MARKIWVAKISDNLGKFHTYELSPRFESIYDCQKYIDDNLKVIEKFLQNAFDNILANIFVNSKKQFFISLGGSFIRCYNLEQHRFCTGFDF